jgi:GH24 family phage-related lysozyme (muramidase)
MRNLLTEVSKIKSMMGLTPNINEQSLIDIAKQIAGISSNQEPNSGGVVSDINKTIKSGLETAKKSLDKKSSNSNDVEVRTVSNKLRQFIKCSEGDKKQKCSPVLTSYNIPGEQYDTVGWGHYGEDVSNSYKKITNSVAEDLFNKDIEENTACVTRMLDRWKAQGLKTYKLTQGQFDACVSYTFNSGCGGLLGSKFIQQTKLGNHEKAAEILRTENITQPGHKPRREKESNMYKGIYS